MGTYPWLLELGRIVVKLDWELKAVTKGIFSCCRHPLRFREASKLRWGPCNRLGIEGRTTNDQTVIRICMLSSTGDRELQLKLKGASNDGGCWDLTVFCFSRDFRCAVH